MSVVHTAEVLLGLYAAFLAVGGIMGYTKAGSRASLIAGGASAGLCATALLISVFVDARTGLVVATVLTLALTVLFNYRFVAKSRRIFPTGVLAFVSLGVFAWVLVAALRVGAAAG